MSTLTLNPMVEQPASLYLRFREIAQAAPQSCALIIDNNKHTYSELLTRIDRCAAGLAQAGVRPGEAVALAFPNSLDFVVAAFAAFSLSTILVPLNPQFTRDELRHCLQQTSPKAMLYPPDLHTLIEIAPACTTVHVTSIAAISTDPIQPLPQTDPNQLTGLYLFSSGSTGQSKRITRTQQQVLTEYLALCDAINLQQSDCVLCTLPLFHSHGFSNALMAALLSGGQLVLTTANFNARASMQALSDHKVTIYPVVPFMIKLFADTHFSPAPNLQALRLVISAGAALPELICKRFYDAFSISVSQLYGSTETGAISINVAHSLDKPASVGRPLAGTKITVRDEHGTVLPLLNTGEICVKASSAASKYDGLAELSDQCFKDGSFFTGDLGYLDAHEDLFITGRKKLLINVAGYKVDPLEVEDVLSSHPQVTEALVMGVAHSGAGERLKAWVVLAELGSCSERELIEFAASRLAAYKVPKIVEFLPELPRNSMGKLLRKHF